jgi:dienelactone hydrolase
MRIIVASDIHGIHDQLRAQLAVLGEPIIVSPWPGEGRPYATEQDAASAFHQQDGPSSYEQKIAEAVNGEAALLIGFSVGATSLWRYVAGSQCSTNSRAFLYYGSRIRDYLTLVPRCPTSVFFAEHEPSFHPESVAISVRESGALCSVISGTRHGFMSPTSSHYRPDLAQEHLDMLLSRIHAINQ